jgi:hypothetical protein
MQRLIGVDYQGQGSIDYVYDNMGNRLVETQQTGTLPNNHPPSAVQALTPADGATGVENTVNTLSWTPATDPDAGDTVSYYLYLGKNATPPLVYSGTKASANICLSPGSTYYWQVNARDNHNAETPSPVWSFQTLATGHTWCDLIEGFETADAFDKLAWQRKQAPNSIGWQQTSATVYEGAGAAVSPQGLKNNQKASMAVSLKTVTGTVSFWFSVNSAQGDYLEFYVDGNRRARWQGVVAWTQATIPVMEGTHTFTWQYSKDGANTAGEDRAWVDAIFFPLQPDSVF